MHKTTEENLKIAQKWTMDVIRADGYLTALEHYMPADVDGGQWASITNSFGALKLHIRDAEGVAAVGPYLRALRQAGFRRTGGARQDEINNAVTWNYGTGTDEDDYGERVRIEVVLTLAQAAKESEATCGYVQVGVKEVPDVKLLCGQELADWRAGQQVEA